MASTSADGFGSGGLGNLAQAARTSHLKSARGILLFVGITSALLNIGVATMAKSIVNEGIQRELEALPPGMVVDEAKVEEIRTTAVRSTQLVSGIGAAIGVTFIILAFLVYAYPVPTTIASLVLYLGTIAGFGYHDPDTLTRHWLVKALIVAALFKAVQAALASEKPAPAEAPVGEPAAV